MLAKQEVLNIHKSVLNSFHQFKIPDSVQNQKMKNELDGNVFPQTVGIPNRAVAQWTGDPIGDLEIRVRILAATNQSL